MRAMQALDAELATLDALGESTAGLWTGKTTQTDAMEAALRFQASRAQVTDSGALPGVHPEVAAGDCGAALSADHECLQQRAALEDQLSHCADLHATTGGVWQFLNTSEEDVTRVEKFHASLTAAVAHLAAGSSDLAQWHAALERLLGDDNTVLNADGHLAQAGREYTEAWAALHPSLEKLITVGSFSHQGSTDFNDAPIDELALKCRQLLASESRLNAWCAWQKVRNDATAQGLTPIVQGIESGAIEPVALRQTFEVNHSRWWLNAVVDSEPVVSAFVSAEHEKRIGDFRALDKRFIELTRDWVRASLCSGLPAKEDVTRNSEWGILRHEMSKKKRHMPLRELIRSTPEVLTQLTPCLLMSPLSIAQFLPTESKAFDLVVFDEASQIPVWDAIGAIARGKQVVMVGDPKQLPPTNFFDRAESGMDDEDVETDLESILDECMGANLPTMNLAWHYRSRNESLIAFSNHRYYGGELVTFPSPVTNDQAVSFHPVPGVYAKGGARTNAIEAKAVVADVVARLTSPGFQASGLTIGIVTFNTEQMGLIEDLLDEERRKNPALEMHFAESMLEPLFVKNLESVQGDERDIMYFSITYGPDLAGAVSMNFGPMNREGGERRLNVAITRARHELRVFSSLKAEQFDLTRTQAKGVQDLKHFLEFAERGTRALAEATKGSLGGFESPFEAAVATALAAKGWEVQTQIGASSFRIDLAVVHPDARGTYLAGVECDGATYHRSATARDRDMLREQVLRGLGWDILRVWSTDWWIDRVGTLAKVHSALESLLANSRASRADRQRKQEEEISRLAAIAASTQRPSEMAAPPPHLAEMEPTRPAIRSNTPPSTDRSTDANQVQPELFMGQVSPLLSDLFETPFTEADPASVIGTINADAFYETTYEPVLRRMIEHVVEAEGPVLDEVLARRIARAHGWSRTGGRILERVRSIAQSVCRSTQEDRGTFYWPASSDPAQPVPFRMPKDGSSRNVNEMAPQELMSLASKVIGSGLSGDEAVLAMAHALGLRQVRASSKAHLAQLLAACTATQGHDVTG
jgi:very-short-patch-repair endonuclease